MVNLAGRSSPRITRSTRRWLFQSRPAGTLRATGASPTRTMWGSAKRSLPGYTSKPQASDAWSGRISNGRYIIAGDGSMFRCEEGWDKAWDIAIVLKLSEFTDVSLPRVQRYNFKRYLMYCQPCNADKLRIERNQRIARQRWEMYECN